MGLPLPGETTLVTAAIYAATTRRLNIWLVIAAAASGAIAGDSAGFWIGRVFGHRLLLKYGGVLRMTPRRIKLGQYLFQRHGGKVVFFGRFFALLRALAALLAGINCMDGRRFLLFNVSGGIVWACVFGLSAFAFGQEVERMRGTAGIVLSAVGLLSAIGGLWFVRRHETALEDRAERALPGPPQ
ncbi:MAG TPA: DedA family protein [Vicinamibacterales bacterium]|jgi:membrane protein DedA with SNARE-associated domain|nr:DedA family protein [Vicinamibacterales bacterium]